MPRARRTLQRHAVPPIGAEARLEGTSAAAVASVRARAVGVAHEGERMPRGCRERRVELLGAQRGQVAEQHGDGDRSLPARAACDDCRWRIAAASAALERPARAAVLAHELGPARERGVVAHHDHALDRRGARARRRSCRARRPGRAPRARRRARRVRAGSWRRARPSRGSRRSTPPWSADSAREASTSRPPPQHAHSDGGRPAERAHARSPGSTSRPNTSRNSAWLRPTLCR